VPYVFELEALLRLQHSLERQEENRLLALATQVIKLKSEMADLERASVALRGQTQQEMASGLPASVLQFVIESQRTLERRSKKLQEELVVAEDNRLRQIGVYRQTRQKRDLLEVLREKRRELYETEQARRQQQTIDDLFLVRNANRG
jgi:flagellar export protein FliJ